MADLAGATKVNDLDRTPFWIAEQYVLWLQVAVDDTQLGSG